MDYLGAEISKKIKSAIRAKLVELGVYVDDELPDYIMVLVANKKTKGQMERDLALFLSDHTVAFVEWLQQVLDKLQTITLQSKDKNGEEEKNAKGSSTKEREKKRKSSEVSSDNAKKGRSDDTKEKERKRSAGEPHKSKKDKDAKHTDKDARHSDKDKDAKHSDPAVSKKREERTKSRDSRDGEERTRSRESRESREHREPEERTRTRSRERAAPAAKPSEVAAGRRSSRSRERESGSEGRASQRRSSQPAAAGDGKKHPRISAPAAAARTAAPPDDEEDQDVLNLSAEEDELVKEAPAPRQSASAPSARAAPAPAPAPVSTTVRQPSVPSVAPTAGRTSSSGGSGGSNGGGRVVNVREESGLYSRRVVTDDTSARRRSSRSRSPVRRREVKVAEAESRSSRRGPQSTVGAVVSREVDDTEYDPLNPAVGAVASTVRVTERPRRPASEQPRPTLLLKAMRDAQRSTVASVRPFLVRAQNEPKQQQQQQQRNKRESRELYTASLAGRQRRAPAPAPAATTGGAPRAVQARSQRSGSPGQIAVTVRNAPAAAVSPGRRRRRRSRQTSSPPARSEPPTERLKEKMVVEEARSPEPSSDEEDTVHVTIGKVKSHPHHTEPAAEMPEYRPTPTVLPSVDDISAIVHAVADRIKNPPQTSTDEAKSLCPGQVSLSEAFSSDVSTGSPPDPVPLTTWQSFLPMASWPTVAPPDPTPHLPPAPALSPDPSPAPSDDPVVLTPYRERPSSPTFVVTMTGLGASRFARSMDAALAAEDAAPEDLVVEEEEEEEEELEEDDLRQQLLEDRARKAHPVVAPPPLELEAVPAPKPTTRCRFWPNCKLGTECSFHHPTVPCKTFPACKFGDACLYVHPACKFDGSCTRPDCRFAHSAPRPAAAAAAAPVAPFGGGIGARPANRPGSKAAECKFFPNCTNPACPFIHPKMCRYAEACSNPSCLFTHPTPAPAAGRPQFKWVAPGAI